MSGNIVPRSGPIGKATSRLDAPGHATLRFAAVVCTAVVVTALAGSAARAQSAGDGATSFAAYGCYQCHGYEGQGGDAGPRIGPSPYPYVAFARFVRRPVNVMPAYAPEVLSEAILRTIYDYVRSRPEPESADSIRLLE